MKGKTGEQHIAFQEADMQSEEKNKKFRPAIIGVVLLLAALLTGIFLIGGREKELTLSETMKDAVLHGENKISLFGLIEVNPSLISAFVVTGVLLLFAAAVRIFVIPRFKEVPGKFQSILEAAVGYFDGLSSANSPHNHGALGMYVFAAGAYIFVGTLFELLGFQAITTSGESISLPSPLSDINAAVAMGATSYLFILAGGIKTNGARGIGRALKEFSLPISMSFRLFGALLSGLLVTELVYYSLALSFVLPVVVGVLFTILHALIQAYVLTMLTSVYFGEVTAPHIGKNKSKKIIAIKA